MSPDPLADPGIEAAPAPGAAQSVLRLEASLVIGDVGEFYQACHRALENAGPLTIDGSAIEVIDGAGLQLLAACVKEAVGQGREVCWQAASDALRRASRVMGVDQPLGLGRTSMD